jgi:hypothetical protein
MEDIALDSYVEKRVLRLAVERLFEIVGKSLNLAIQSDDSLKHVIADFRSIIGL